MSTTGLRGYPWSAPGRVRHEQGNSANGWAQGKSDVMLDRYGKVRQDGERKVGRPWKIRPKELREYRKDFLIFRI
jgi:hypothetical protein